MKAKVRQMAAVVGYGLVAGDYDKKEAYLNSFEKGQVLKLLGDVSFKKVLDVGAGTGRLAIALAGKKAEVTALDVSSEMLRVLEKKNGKIKTVVGEAESLPFPEQSFDLVIAAFLIVHLKDLAKFFDEVYRVLKPGGRFLVTNINQKRPPELSSKQGKILIKSYFHRPDKVRELLESLAFSIKKEEMIKEGEVWINQIVLAEK